MLTVGTVTRLLDSMKQSRKEVPGTITYISLQGLIGKLMTLLLYFQQSSEWFRKLAVDIINCVRLEVFTVSPTFRRSNFDMRVKQNKLHGL
jgi:hypothetical protein